MQGSSSNDLVLIFCGELQREKGCVPPIEYKLKTAREGAGKKRGREGDRGREKEGESNINMR